MSQEIRVILAVVISAAIFIVYQTFFMPLPPPHPVAVSQTVATTDAAMPSVAAPHAITEQQPPVSNADETFVALAQDITIDTDKAKIVLNTVGGTLKSYILRGYHGYGDDASAKNMLQETGDSSALFLGLSGYDGLTPHAVFKLESDTTLKGGARKIVLAWQDKNIRVERSFVFGGDASPYVVHGAYTVSNRSNASYALAPFIMDSLHQRNLPQKNGLLSKLSQSQPDLFMPEYYKAQNFTVRGAPLPKGSLTLSSASWDGFAPLADEGFLTWGGITDRYFLIAHAPDLANDTAATALAKTSISFARDGDFLLGRFAFPAATLNPGASVSGTFLSYVGPKKLSDLKTVGIGLDKAVDYGWFHVLASPILWLMVTLHKVIPNWGLVIIALTLLVKMALHPVNKKSLASMKAMQQLQPKLQEIKKRHPNDSQKQNEEVMQLFRTHKVNPMGGCLPMLLQMPIYVVLYKVLWNAIELYHAPFLWYRDLSAPDPYFIAPILLGLFMFLQQKLTPSASADPAQQKMMMFMPVMFCGFMLFVPVGLVVYIFVNTFMSVVQQFMLQRDLSFKDLLTGKWQANGA